MNIKEQLTLPFKNEEVRQEKGEEKRITIKDLYPQLSDEELEEAEFNLKRYFEICKEIYEDYSEEELKKLLEESRKMDKERK